MLQAPRSQVPGPRRGRLEEKVEATQAEGAQILNEARHLQHFPNTVLLDLYGFMILLNYYDAAKLRLKAPRKEKTFKKTRCRRCAQVLQVSFHDSKTYCTQNSYIKGYLHYMVIWVAWSHQLLFFSAASMPQSFLVLDSRRIIPETHRPLMTIGSIPGMGVFDIKGVGL